MDRIFSLHVNRLQCKYAKEDKIDIFRPILNGYVNIIGMSRLMFIELEEKTSFPIFKMTMLNVYSYINRYKALGLVHDLFILMNFIFYSVFCF